MCVCIYIYIYILPSTYVSVWLSTILSDHLVYLSVHLSLRLTDSCGHVPCYVRTPDYFTIIWFILHYTMNQFIYTFLSRNIFSAKGQINMTTMRRGSGKTNALKLQLERHHCIFSQNIYISISLTFIFFHTVRKQSISTVLWVTSIIPGSYLSHFCCHL